MRQAALHGSVRILHPHTPCEETQFSPRIWTWKLRDPATASLFQSAFKVKMMTAEAAVATASGADSDPANQVESPWSRLKGPLLDVATEVCGLSKNRRWKPETWWWNEEVGEAREACMVQGLQCPEKRRHDGGGQEGKNCLHWCQAHDKHADWLAKSEAEKEEFTILSPDGVFRTAKQMDCRNQDIVGGNWCNDAGEFVLTDEDKMKAWVEHYAALLNVEFVWPSNGLPEVPPIAAVRLRAW